MRFAHAPQAPQSQSQALPGVLFTRVQAIGLQDSPVSFLSPAASQTDMCPLDVSVGFWE